MPCWASDGCSLGSCRVCLAEAAPAPPALLLRSSHLLQDGVYASQGALAHHHHDDPPPSNDVTAAGTRSGPGLMLTAPWLLPQHPSRQSRPAVQAPRICNGESQRRPEAHQGSCICSCPRGQVPRQEGQHHIRAGQAGSTPLCAQQCRCFQLKGQGLPGDRRVADCEQVHAGGQLMGAWHQHACFCLQQHHSAIQRGLGGLQAMKHLGFCRRCKQTASSDRCPAAVSTSSDHQTSCKQYLCKHQGCEPAGSGSDNMYCSSVGSMAELGQSVGKAGCGTADDKAADDSSASEWTVLDDADAAGAPKPGQGRQADVIEQVDTAALGHAATIIQAAYR